MPKNPALTPKLLLQAYTQGYFPMFVPELGEVQWFCPDPRGVLFLDQFHCPKSLARRYRSGRFVITSDMAFSRVIQECGTAPRSQSGTWITDAFVQAYTGLHNAQMAHSIEAWLPADTQLPVRDLDTCLVCPLGPEQKPHVLVAGLYGVHLGSIFFGESMFHRATDGSRVCLVALVEHLRKQHFSLLEVQAVNAHTQQFNATSIPHEKYMELLWQGLMQNARW